MKHPPRWAEQVLLLLLPTRDQESIPGDLAEEYGYLAETNPSGADVWYVREVFGHMCRRTLPWAVVFSGAFIARTAADWLYPVTDFRIRSTVSTGAGVTILFALGFAAAWKARRILSGPLTAVVTTQIAAVLSIAGIALLLSFRHDPATWNAINASGGFAEALELPFFMIVPGIVIGTIAGVAGKLCRAATT